MADIEAEQTEIVDERRELLENQFAELDANPPPAQEVVSAPSDTGRASDGKFAAKTAESLPTGGKTALDTPEEPVWARPPKSWKKDYHDVWNTADPRLREYAYEREEQMRSGVETAQHRAVAYDHIQRIIEPYMPTINGLGLDAPQAIKGLMEADHILRTSPMEHKRAYLLQLADHYGIQLGDVSQHAPTASSGNPDLYALKNELNQVRGEVVGWKKAQEEAANQSLLQDIAIFAKGKEHFEEVRPAMASLLQAGLASDLESAYTQAIRLNDELFTSEQSALQAKSEAERRGTANRAAKAARGAAVSVRGSTPGVAARTNAQDRRSMLVEQFDNMTDRL